MNQIVAHDRRSLRRHRAQRNHGLRAQSRRTNRRPMTSFCARDGRHAVGLDRRHLPRREGGIEQSHCARCLRMHARAGELAWLAVQRLGRSSSTRRQCRRRRSLHKPPRRLSSTRADARARIWWPHPRICFDEAARPVRARSRPGLGACALRCGDHSHACVHDLKRRRPRTRGGIGKEGQRAERQLGDRLVSHDGVHRGLPERRLRERDRSGETESRPGDVSLQHRNHPDLRPARPARRMRRTPGRSLLKPYPGASAKTFEDWWRLVESHASSSPRSPAHGGVPTNPSLPNLIAQACDAEAKPAPAAASTSGSGN